MGNCCIVKGCSNPKATRGRHFHSDLCSEHLSEFFLKPTEKKISERLERDRRHTNLVIAIHDGKVKELLKKHGVSNEIIEVVFKEASND